MVDQVLGEILDRLEGREQFDLMADLADGFPITVISRLLGIPAADATHFSQIGELVGQSLDGVRTVRQAQEAAPGRPGGSRCCSGGWLPNVAATRRTT